jgi:valyl-tRNA synthetase
MRTEEENLVPLVEAKKIMQPFGDRSKVVIEPMLTDQWFVATDKIVQPAIDAVRSGEVTILPEQDRKVYFHWLENIEPWCISRQLWWGHQIPVWYGPEIAPGKTIKADGLSAFSSMDGRPFCASNFEEARKQALEYYGSDILVLDGTSQGDLKIYGKSAKALPSAGGDPKTNSVENVYLHRDPDVLDTWFSSGLWPIGTLGWPEQTAELEKYFPTSVLVTGFDIIFFWVARMMMMQYAVVDQKPFDTVYVHALVRDEKGKKMSKSLGNVLDPLELIDEFGADAVRFTVTSMAAMGRDLKLSTQRIAGYRNFGTKLWNAHRFAEMNNVFASMPAAMPQPQATLNKWIVGETARIREEVDAALGNFRFNDAANALYAFVWGKVCDWYVELSKPLLQDDAPEAEETRATMAWVLEQCLVLLHPIMPFITEELWQTTTKRDQLLALTDWPTYTTADLLDAEADRELNWVIGLIESIRSARQQMHVPAGLKVPMLVTEMDEAAQGAWDRNEVMIKRLARVESLERAESFPKGTVSIAAPGASFGLPLAGLIDIDAEKARLQKSLDKLGKEIGGLKGRLNNPKFAASAPEEVVAEAQANLAARQEEADQLQAALDRLAELG